MILASRVPQSRFKDAGIDYDLRGTEKPSGSRPDLAGTGLRLSPRKRLIPG
ncbi:hypothetical protein ACPA9J_02445 [Pseudomonas aeruginosa]